MRSAPARSRSGGSAGSRRSRPARRRAPRSAGQRRAAGRGRDRQRPEHDPRQCDPPHRILERRDRQRDHDLRHDRRRDDQHQREHADAFGGISGPGGLLVNARRRAAAHRRRDPHRPHHARAGHHAAPRQRRDGRIDRRRHRRFRRARDQSGTRLFSIAVSYLATARSSSAAPGSPPSWATAISRARWRSPRAAGSSSATAPSAAARWSATWPTTGC